MKSKRGDKIAESIDIQVEIMPTEFDEFSARPDEESIVDRAGSADIQPAHIAEAAGYHSLDRANWAKPSDPANLKTY